MNVLHRFGKAVEQRIPTDDGDLSEHVLAVFEVAEAGSLVVPQLAGTWSKS